MKFAFLRHSMPGLFACALTLLTPLANHNPSKSTVKMLPIRFLQLKFREYIIFFLLDCNKIQQKFFFLTYKAKNFDKSAQKK